MQKRFGKLTVKLMSASELKQPTAVGKADPYARVTIGQQTYETKVHSGGGKEPRWEQSFDFDISNEKDITVCQCCAGGLC